MSSNAHPAETAARAAMAAVTDGDRVSWLSLYADAAVLHDPVGGSPLDPEGAGMRGRAALETFWGLMIAPNAVRFDIHAVHPGGNEAAVVASVSITLGTGQVVRYDGVFVYAVDHAGLITSVRSYFDVERLLAELAT